MIWGSKFWFLILLVLGVLALLFVIDATAGVWSFSESRRPVSLKGCPERTKIVINYSVSVYGPFRSFCYE